MTNIKAQSIYFKLLKLLSLVVLLISCEGTVEQTKKNKSNVTQTNDPQIAFSGIEFAVPISDRRIEVFFKEAISLNNKKIVYLIYVSGLEDPIPYTAEGLFKDYRGLYKITLKNLSPGTNYYIKVNAREEDSNDILETGKDSGKITTFTNSLSNFDGIFSVSNAPGMDGLDSIIVNFSHPATGPGLSGAPVSYYEVTIIAGASSLNSGLSPADMNDTTKGSEQGRYTRLINFDNTRSSYQLSGFPSDTLLYVQIRAIHTDSINNPSEPWLRSELNTNYATIKTFNNDLSSLDFQAASFKIVTNGGAFADASKKAEWGSIVGVFDHFRIYYAKNQNDGLEQFLPHADVATTTFNGCTSTPKETQVLGVFCKKVPSSLDETILSDLETNKWYTFVLTICGNPSCSNKIIFNQRTSYINALFGSFSGITSIVQAKNLSELEQNIVRLKFLTPSFENGTFDGLEVHYANGNAPTTVHNPATDSYSVDSFDHTLDDEVVIRNLSYNNIQDQCFKLIPYIFGQPAGVKIYNINETSNAVCAKLEIRTPTSEEFKGFNDPDISSTANGVFLEWEKPTIGVYSHYEIFIKKTPGSFSFIQATLDYDLNISTDYQRILIDSNLNERESVTLVGFPTGFYKLGIRSYVEVNGEIHRSENNGNVLTCEVDPGNNNAACALGN
jgi:hypothetical protein